MTGTSRRKVLFIRGSVILKILVILVFMGLTTVIVGYVGHSKIKEMNQVANDIFFSNTSIIFPLSDFMETIYRTENSASAAVRQGSSGAISALSSNLTDCAGQVGNFKFYLTPEESAEFDQYWNKYEKAVRDLYNELRNNGPAAAALYLRFRNESGNLYRHAYELSKSRRIQGLSSFNQGKIVFSSAVALQTWITVVGVLMATIIGLLVALSIIHPLQALRRTANCLAEGDLRAQTDIRSHDEVGMVAGAFNQAVQELRSMVTNAYEHAKKINVASHEVFSVVEATNRSFKEINEAIEALAVGASSQTTTVEEALKAVQKAVNGSTAVIKDTLDINNLCQEAALAANRGGEAAAEMIKTIDGFVGIVREIEKVVGNLADDSKEIQDMVEVINDIAEKTTLLSLNASIEAARAGEYGRGFAVVAANIRKLSARSQESAAHINKVISRIIDRTDTAVTAVEQGTEEVDKGRRTLLETLEVFEELIKRVDQIAGGIANITETASKISDENKAAIPEMTKISRISQDNLAAIEEVSATFEEQYSATSVVTEAARELQSLAEALAAAADRFKI